MVDLVAELNLPAERATRLLEAFFAEGHCRPQTYQGTHYYIFDRYLPKIRVCSYCESVFQENHRSCLCKNCGAELPPPHPALDQPPAYRVQVYRLDMSGSTTQTTPRR